MPACLTPQPEAYPLALALAQAAPALPAPQGDSLASEALRLLGEAPTSGEALAQLSDLLLSHDGGQRLRALLAPQGAAPPAVLMYAAQCLCRLAAPQVVSLQAAPAGAPPELLQRRLLLSGALGALLGLATQLAAAAAPAPASPVELAAHGAVLLLLCNTHEALQAQEAAAAASVVAEAAAAAAAVAPPAAGESASAMQVDSASAGGDDGSTVAGDGAAGSAPPPGLAAERSPSVSMAAASADASDAEASAAAARQEVGAAAAALAALAPAAARYILRMLCCVLRCGPGGPQDGAAAAAAAALPLPVSPSAMYLSVDELCSQALRLLCQLSQQSSAAVEAVLSGEAAAAEAVVRRLLLHPASTQAQRQLAADWLPQFACAAPGAHRWAFERIVQPLLLEGGEGAGAGAGSSSGGGGGGGAGGSAAQVAVAQEQTALCNHFIHTLDPAEVRLRAFGACPPGHPPWPAAPPPTRGAAAPHRSAEGGRASPPASPRCTRHTPSGPHFTPFLRAVPRGAPAARHAAAAADGRHRAARAHRGPGGSGGRAAAAPRLPRGGGGELAAWERGWRRGRGRMRATAAV